MEEKGGGREEEKESTKKEIGEGREEKKKSEARPGEARAGDYGHGTRDWHPRARALQRAIGGRGRQEPSVARGGARYGVR